MARKDPSKAMQIRKQIKTWDDNWKYNRDQYHLFTSFVLGEQWTEDESRVFENYRKIPLTMNKLAPLISHLVGEQRQNTPQLQVVPEDAVPAQAAEIREGLVKDISLSSHAKVVYQNAFQQAAVGGFGAAVVTTEYEHERSFNLVPRINGVKDPTRCYWDTGAESPSKTDGMFAGYRTRFTRKRFRAIYGKRLEQSIPTSQEESTFIAVADDDSITVIDHFERTYKTETIYHLSNGMVVTSQELKELEKIEFEDKEVYVYNGEPVQIEGEREAHSYKVRHSKWAGDFELESSDFPSEQLPVVFLDQNSYWDKRGRQICRPFIKDAKDAQKYINYLATQSAYLLKVSRYDQFMASKANVRSADTSAAFRDPSTVLGTLFYDESPNGNKPERLAPPELSQSLISQYERAMMDIETSTGMYKTQMGERGNETSGVAIDARTRRGSYNTFVPFDSLNRFIATIGEIINEMIPILYDTERTLKVNLRDKGETEVTINQPKDQYSNELENDMTKGRFKIRLMPGPSYEGQKRENLESLQLVLQANPQLFQLIGDLYAENLPLANNIELKNRIRTIIPPEIIEAGKTGQPLPPKPEQQDPKVELEKAKLQFQMQEAQMQAQLKMKDLELQEQKVAIEAHQSGVDFGKEIKNIELKKEETIAKLREQEMRFEAEMKRIEADLHLGHAGNMLKILTHHPKHLDQKGSEKHGNA